VLDPRSSTRTTALALGLLLGFASGCIADEPILEPNGSFEWLGSMACESLVAEGVVAELTTGQLCRSSYSCGHIDACSGFTADCREHEDLAIYEVSVLECPIDHRRFEFVPPSDHVPWVDCDAALRDGRSGQTCGAAFTCGRVAGACCAELASCGVVYPRFSDIEAPAARGDEARAPEPSQRLIRVRACTQDCQNVTPDESAVATDCASAYTQDTKADPLVSAIGRRCSGDFVCMNGVDLRASGVAQGIDFTDDPRLAFCQDGVVLGRADAIQPQWHWPAL
jgi:hypothetical protein